MFVACWKAIGSPSLSQSLNTLEGFDGRDSHLFGILTCFPITLEGKMVNIKVEVVEANLTYNLLLGQTWTYVMHAISSSLFYTLRFPHQGKIVMIDQLSLFCSSSSEGNVPYVEHTSIPYESVGAGLFKAPTLMGIFPLPPPNVAFVNMISVNPNPLLIRPLIQVDSWVYFMLLSPTELKYVQIVLASVSSSESTPSSRYIYTYVQSPSLGDISSPNPLRDISI